MGYKDKLVVEIKSQLATSIVAAKKINEAWEQLESYFGELSDDLGMEIELLGDYVEIYNDDDSIEFYIREQGLRLAKDVFGISLTKRNGKEYGTWIYAQWKYFECRDGKVVEISDGEELTIKSVDSWIKEFQFEKVLL